MQKAMFARGGVQRKGFALPTVLISSVILLTMLAVTVGAVNSARLALQGQYYTQLAESAAQSGLEMAEACIEEGYLTWDKPLRPGGDCYGSATACITDECYIVRSSDVRTTFEVSAPNIAGDVNTITSKGSSEKVRLSSGAVWKQYNANLRMQDRVADVNPGDEVKWRQVVAGLSHTCAISTKGNTYCWGSNSNGQLGIGSTTSQSEPTLISRGLIPNGVTATDISVGDNHTCIIGSNKLAYCWGSNGSGELGDGTTSQRTTPVAVQLGAMPAGSTIVDLVNTSLQYTCAIASNERVYCWGNNSYGQLGDGTKTNRSTPVLVQQGAMPANPVITQASAGGYHVCAIVANNGRPYCWGYNANTEGRLGSGATTAESLAPVAVAQGALPAGLQVSYLAAGRFHTCAIAPATGQTYCWGRNSASQSGDGTTTSNPSPSATGRGSLPSDRNALALGSGGDHSCSLASDSVVYCWGLNTYGQLGNNTTNTSSLPQPTGSGAMPAGVSIAQLSGGGAHTCGVGTDANIYCWGRGDNGRLGTGSTLQESVPAKVSVVYEKSTALRFKKVSTGSSSACGISSDDAVYCWGYNGWGTVGTGTTSVAAGTPTKVSQGQIPTGVIAKDVDIDGSTACMVGSNNRVYCWGYGGNGELGNGSTANASTPRSVSLGAIPASASILQVSVGGEHTCVLASNGNVYCWGGLTDDWMTNNGAPNVWTSTPLQVSFSGLDSGEQIRLIKADSYYTCILTSSNKVRCEMLTWEGDFSGDYSTLTLGWTDSTGGYTDVSSFPGGLSIMQYDRAGDASCALASDAWVYCWGYNTYGQLGNGSTTATATPTPIARGAIPTGVAIRKVVVGWNYACALATDGKVYCWGSGLDGRLGRGSTANSSVPVAVSQGAMPASSTVRTLFDTNGSHICAAAMGGSIYCWGNSNYGEVGDGTTMDATVPVPLVYGDTNSGIALQSISAGSRHACAIGSDAKSYCWGSSDSAQLGKDNYIDIATPTSPLNGALPGGLVRQIAPSTGDGSHTCAVGMDSRGYCWGLAFAGQLGYGNSSFVPTGIPTPIIRGAVPQNYSVRQMAAGSTSSCMIATDNKVYCWGQTASALAQGALPSGSMVQQLSSGSEHYCAIGSDSKPYCWGTNTSGRLGNNTTTNSSAPVAVSQGSMPAGVLVQQISAGSSHSCAIASNSRAYCWGLGSSGQLGRGSTTSSSIPVTVSQGAMPSGAIVRQISAGGTHTCAIAQNHKAYCWGLGSSGQLGRGSTTNATSAIAVSGGELPATALIKQISAGDQYTCALTFSDEVYCWGLNTSGQLGDGTRVNSTRPVKVDFATPDSVFVPDYTLLGPRRFF